MTTKSSDTRVLGVNKPRDRGTPWGLFGLIALCYLVYLPAVTSAASLNDVTYTSLPGDRVQIRLELSEPVTVKPLSFTVDNPARIALDFPNTQLKVKQKARRIGIGAAQSVSSAEAGGRSRVVVNLVRMVPYDVQLQGKSVLITLANTAGAADQQFPVASGTPQAPVKPQPQATAPSSARGAASAQRAATNQQQGAHIQNVDFRRGTQGQGRVVIALSEPGVSVNIREEGGKVLVDFSGTALPAQLDRKLDVIDFATPVKEVNTFRRGNGTRMVITPLGDFEHLAYQSDNILTVEVRALTKQEKQEIKKKKFGYTGERLSLNFQNIEVRAVLQLIADFTGRNMVASDTVSGNVTLRLKNVPWDQALDIILKSKGLGMREEGNVIMVAPQEEIAAREKLELESQQQIEELAPLRTEFIQANYAKAEDLANLLKDEQNNLLSERGNLSVDERTNTLLVQDVAAKLEEMRKVINKLDIPVRQVLIESRIVVADEDFSRDLGVRFGYSKDFENAPTGEFNSFLGGGRAGNTNFNGTTAFHTDSLENYIVDLPVANPAGAMAFAVGKVGTWLLQLELSALEAEGRGEVISSPRVITANQKEAIIEQGTEIPFEQATSSGATSLVFKKAVLSLKVTPQITPDDRLILDLKVNKDSVGEVIPGQGVGIDTNRVETQVLVDNGETVVLGGVFQHEKRSDSRHVPFFGNLPYVGHLFKNTAVKNDKTELLIFVTPKIIKESLSMK